MSWSSAEAEFERSGTGFRFRVVRRDRESDFAMLARSMARLLALGSLGFYKRERMESDPLLNEGCDWTGGAKRWRTDIQSTVVVLSRGRRHPRPGA